MKHLFARKKAITRIENAFFRLIKTLSDGKATSIDIKAAKTAYLAALAAFGELLHSQPVRDARFYTQNATVMMLHGMSKELIEKHNDELIEAMRTSIVTLAEELPPDLTIEDKIHNAAIRTHLKKPSIT